MPRREERRERNGFIVLCTVFGVFVMYSVRMLKNTKHFCNAKLPEVKPISLESLCLTDNQQSKRVNRKEVFDSHLIIRLLVCQHCFAEKNGHKILQFNLCIHTTTISPNTDRYYS